MTRPRIEILPPLWPQRPSPIERWGTFDAGILTGLTAALLIGIGIETTTALATAHRRAAWESGSQATDAYWPADITYIVQKCQVSFPGRGVGFSMALNGYEVGIVANGPSVEPVVKRFQ